MKNKVKYNLGFGLFMIAGSVFIIGASVLTGFSFNTITGILLLIFGILYLTNPAIEYDKKELEIKNAFGRTVKIYSFEKDKLEMKDGAIYSNQGKIRAGSFFLNKTELNELFTFIDKKEYLK